MLDTVITLIIPFFCASLAEYIAKRIPLIALK